MNVLRLQILEGTLSLPSYQNFKDSIGPYYADLADKMFKAMWYQYLKDKGSINLTFWSDRFDNPIIFNQILMALSTSNWIITHSIPSRNWAEANLNEDKLLAYVTPNELEEVRAHKKYFQYVQKLDKATRADSVRVNGKVKATGLIRDGFMKSGNTVFSFDQDMMNQYSSVIQANLTKSMDKIAQLCPNLRHDKASYDTISVDILNYHLTTDESFSAGNRDSDSRGRNIHGNLDKVANPISSKDFRSLLVIK